VNVFYKCEKVLPNGRIETEEYPLKDLHFPTSVMRAIYHYSTTREASKLTYDLKHPDGSWGNYVSLRKLVAYLSKTFRFHTKHVELRLALNDFASKTGQYMRESPDGSGTLVAMRLYLDGTSMETMEQFSQTHPGDIVVALGAKGRYFHNRFLENDLGLIVFDAGRQSGLRVGTPVTVLRGDRPLYSALIVDVRDSLSGAVLQDRMADAGDVEIGDGIRLLPEQNTL
jgi:hypothetical protein